MNNQFQLTREIVGKLMISTAGLICFAGGAALDPDNATARQRGSRMFDALLWAAVAGGSPGWDILEVGFANVQRLENVRDLCRQAAACITPLVRFDAMRATEFTFTGGHNV